MEFPEDDNAAEEPQADATPPSDKVEAQRARLLESLASGVADKLHERVAMLLSRDPMTRDSDIALQLAFWKTYEPDLYADLTSDPATLFRLTRLTSLTRARAKIQNTFGLFQAAPEIRRRRGRMAEDEKERYANPPTPDPLLTVYADESGKTDPHLVVGSVWFVDPADTLRLSTLVARWRAEVGFDAEFHFAKLTADALPFYIQFVDLVLKEIPVSFKSLIVPRRGIGDATAAFRQLFYELLRQGVAHEHDTGRAPLPRRLVLWKDLEAKGADRLLLAGIRDDLTNASAAQFDGRLIAEEFQSVESHALPAIQLADLYTSSINRVLNRPKPTTKPKDVFADYVLTAACGMPDTEAKAGDMEIRLRL